VVDESSNPIPDAIVRLVSNTGLNARVQTKKDGTYRIKIDKNMECVMMASARGYLNKEGKLSTMARKRANYTRIIFSYLPYTNPYKSKISFTNLVNGI